MVMTSAKALVNAYKRGLFIATKRSQLLCIFDIAAARLSFNN